MATRTTTDLEHLLERLEKNGTALRLPDLELLSEEIARLFGVHADEVALLELASSGKALKFLLPAQLRLMGTIPLTSTTALAARTARDRRADVVNNFASSRHVSVFEAVPLGRGTNRSIQKIMSSPILRGDQVVGVAQISRKGNSGNDAGPDFTSRDLIALQNLNPLLERSLTLCRAAEQPA